MDRQPRSPPNRTQSHGLLAPVRHPGSDTPIFIAPPPDRPMRPARQHATEDSELLPRIALDTEPDDALFPR